MHLTTFTAWIAVHIHFIEEDFIDILHNFITVLVLSMQLFYHVCFNLNICRAVTYATGHRGE